MKNHSVVFNNTDTLLTVLVSHGALNSVKTKTEMVKEEALNILVHLKGQAFCECLLFSLFVFFSLLL